MTDLVKRMERKRQALAVVQHKYNQLRGRIPDAEIAIVEGDEDAVFYSSVLKREGNHSIEYFFVANGKDNVLGLRNLILQSKDIPRGGGIIFFVDNDFDGLKSHKGGDDIYVTPTYSVENILVCKWAFKNLLLAEFRLGNAESIADVDRLLLMFDRLCEQHAEALSEVNEIIHCVRRESLKGVSLASGSISDQLKKFADIDAGTLAVTKVATGNAIEKLVALTAPVPAATLAAYKGTFSQLVPKTHWRGKFLYFLFRRFLAVLIEDRNGNVPKYFSKGGGKVSLDTATNSLIRVLAAGCIIPTCLRAFIANIPANKIT